MKKIYLIKTATQCQYTSAHMIDRCTCVLAATELEAAVIAFSNSEAHALNSQPGQTYIFSIECQPQICQFTVDPAMLLQGTFNIWQDLAREATGHDTEWGYPISIKSIADAFHISPKVLAVLLANLTQPELELCLTETALTFHYPPGEVNHNNGLPVLFCTAAAMSGTLGFGADDVTDLGLRLIAVDRPQVPFIPLILGQLWLLACHTRLVTSILLREVPFSGHDREIFCQS
jgi:hypothetical protein